MNNYNWTFPALEAYPEHGGETDVVFTVHYRLDGTDGEHTAGVYGTVGVTFEGGSEFTPFADLTKDQVEGWVVDALGEETVAAMKTNVDGQIENQINPKTITLSPPWVQPTPPQEPAV